MAAERLESALAWMLLLSTLVALALLAPAILQESGLAGGAWLGDTAMVLMALLVVPGALLALLTVVLSLVALGRLGRRVAGRLALWYLLMGAVVISAGGESDGRPLEALIDLLLVAGALYLALAWALRGRRAR